MQQKTNYSIITKNDKKREEKLVMNYALSKSLIEARMMLENLCDGFQKESANKKTTLTAKVKLLFELEKEEKVSPKVLIEKIGIAKSNLAILANGMIANSLIEKVQDSSDKRVIYYKITEKGKEELEKSLKLINEQITNSLKASKAKVLKKQMDATIKLLK